MSALTTQIQKLQEQRGEQRRFIEEMIEKASAEGRDLVDAEQRNLDSARQRLDEIDAQLNPMVDFAKRSDAAAELDGIQHRAETPRREARGQKVWADGFFDSDEIRSWSGYGNSPRVSMPTPGLEQRAVLKTDSITGLPAPTVVGGLPLVHRYPLWDEITKVRVTGTSIGYPTYAHGSLAAKVAEGAAKPEMTWTPTWHEKSLDKYAHWKECTREFYQDNPGGLRDVLQTELYQGVVGALQKAAVDAIAATGTSAVTGTDLLTAARTAIGAVHGTYGVASFLLLNPADYAQLDLQTMAAANTSPQLGISFWGSRIVSDPGVTAGTGYVVDASAVKAYVREETQVFMTDSDVGSGGSSNFKANILTLVAEQRSLIVLEREAWVVPFKKTP